MPCDSAASAVQAAGFERHRPELTLLYQLVERHSPDFSRLMALQDAPLPVYVAREFENYLKCGLLEHGFLRVRCESRYHEKLVAADTCVCTRSAVAEKNVWF